MAKIAFILACLAAIVAPFVVTKTETRRNSTGLIHSEFPATFEGHQLRDVGLSERERYFQQGFPGEIKRFTDGHREIIIRRVAEATRKLHPASDCFKAVGYSAIPLPVRVDEQNKRWACFTAERDNERLNVCERIEGNNAQEWTDVSSWYWSALGSGQGEWWAYTVAELQ